MSARALDLGGAFRQRQFREIKNIPKKNKFISGDKNILPAMFFLLVFSVALVKRPKVFFILSPSLTFQEMCPMFFYLDALINFSKNRLNVFFLQCFFFALIRFVLIQPVDLTSRTMGIVCFAI